MKKYVPIILKIIISFLVVLSLYFLLLSPTTLKINNTHQMAKTIIHRVVSESGNDDLKTSVKMVEDSGLEDFLLTDLPKKYSIDFSYADVYHMSSKYDEKGKLTADDIGLESKNTLTKVINNFLVKEINHKLSEEATQVYHIISIYRYSLFLIILLYLLAIVLILFDRFSASVPLLLGSLGSFGALWYFVNESNSSLQNRVYSGITVQMNLGIYFGLVLGVIIAIGWPFLLKWIRKDETHNA